jgi:cytochrome c oxidase subunit 2
VKGGQKVLADRKYIENSIRYPLEHVREGWAPIMPAYTKNLVTQAELIELVAYIMSLKPGDLPSRTEASPPPIGARIEDTQAPQP